MLAIRQLIPGLWTSGRLKASKGRHPGTWDQLLKCSSVGNWSSFCCAGAISDAVLTAGIVKSACFKQQATSRKHFRMILRNILKKQQAASIKQQAFDMKEIIGYKIGNKGEI